MSRRRSSTKAPKTMDMALAKNTPETKITIDRKSLLISLVAAGVMFGGSMVMEDAGEDTNMKTMGMVLWFVGLIVIMFSGSSKWGAWNYILILLACVLAWRSKLFDSIPPATSSPSATKGDGTPAPSLGTVTKEKRNLLLYVASLVLLVVGNSLKVVT